MATKDDKTSSGPGGSASGGSGRQPPPATSTKMSNQTGSKNIPATDVDEELFPRNPTIPLDLDVEALVDGALADALSPASEPDKPSPPPRKPSASKSEVAKSRVRAKSRSKSGSGRAAPKAKLEQWIKAAV